jgi:hypothetical protein
MVVDAVQKHLKRDAVMQVFTGVDFLANIDAHVNGVIQNGSPAFGQFIKCRLDQTGGALWPRIDVGPRKCARKRHVCADIEVSRSGQCQLDFPQTGLKPLASSRSALA